MRSILGLLLIAALPAASPAPAQDIFQDGFEPGARRRGPRRPGWSCVDGSAPVAGNSTVEEPGDAGCPDGMAQVESFCIDRFEASLARLPAEGGAVWSPYLNPGTTLA